MKTHPRNVSVVKLALFLVCAGFSSAFGIAIVTVPPGLNPGDTYRLVFVTDATTNALSSDISTYNAFATAQANLAPDLAALSTTWKIIGSTLAVSARVNVGNSLAPIYGLDGTRIRDGFGGGVWSGSLVSGIKYSQSGTNLTGVSVWSGTYPDGHTDSFVQPLGLSDVRTGVAGASDQSWNWWIYRNWLNELPVYALSGEVVVAPEPVSAALLLVGGALLALRRRRSLL